ncbi:MAG: adenylate/guanylate cyclase domain-containing protein [Deltaproteobacteria bacterium]|nr:adenylate/guanylate cyclase domain-containing protein [Deltaproteobacteria bacterium]
MAEVGPKLRRTKFSLRLKLTLGLILIIGIIFTAQNLFTLYSHRQSMQEEATISRETVGRVVYSALTGQLASEDLESSRIKNFLTNFFTVAIIGNEKNRDLAFGLVVDTKNRVVAGRARPKLTVFPGNVRYDNEAKVLEEIARLGGSLGGSMRTKRINLQIAGKGEVGKLLIGTSTERLEAEFRRALIVNLGVLAFALLLLVFYSLATLSRLVIHPLSRVVNAMRAVHEGDLDKEVIVNRNDEIGVLASTYNFMVKGLREREQLKDAFSRYVSSQVLQKLKLGDLKLSGEQRTATVLFSDIRSFTALSERLAPADVVSMLNEYFNVMVEIVFNNDGFLNKFIGDALMAIYNVPVEQTEPELRAVKTAIEMIEALDRLNKRRAERGLYAIKIGIGVNTGPVIAGNIGHMKRMEYTVIGDTVNLAQRIESQTKVTGMPLLISETTYQAVAGKVVAQALPPVKVKGKQEPVSLYAVSGLAAPGVTAKVAAPIPVPATSEPAASAPESAESAE